MNISSKIMLLSVIITLTFVFFSCARTTAPVEEAATYLALGDSYTIGESVTESERYPMQLVAKLEDKNITLQKPRIIAKTGWTTSELKIAMTTAKILDEQFDYVSLLIGVNNQYRGQSIDTYAKEFEGLLNDAIQLARGKSENVFVVSIPDWGVTPFGKSSPKQNVSKDIDLFNEVNKKITLSKGVVYIDITPGSRKAKDDASLTASDGLHPSGKMYGQWADAIISQYKFKK